MASQADRGKGISSSILSDNEQIIEAMPMPSAPSEDVVALETGNHHLQHNDDDGVANIKGSLPLPELPLPYAPPYPTGDPPPYDEVTKI